MSLMLWMQRAISDVERMQGPYNMDEELRFRGKALSMKREPMLGQLINTIQLNQEQPMLGVGEEFGVSVRSDVQPTIGTSERLSPGLCRRSPSTTRR